MKIFLSLLVLTTLITCVSCKRSKIEHAIEGLWSIDTILYQNQEISNCISGNFIFRINEDSRFPIVLAQCNSLVKNETRGIARIQLIESPSDSEIPYRLKIDANNKIFSGEKKIIFYGDRKNKLLKMEIFSDSLYIVCRKGLFDLDEHESLVKLLEDLTWTTRHQK